MRMYPSKGKGFAERRSDRLQWLDMYVGKDAEAGEKSVVFVSIM